MKATKLTILIILFLPIYIFAVDARHSSVLQTEAVASRSEVGGVTSVDTFLNANGSTSAYFSIYPTLDLKFWKIGLGFGMPLRINMKNGDIRRNDFDEWQDYLNLINYVSYAKKGEIFYARFGKLYRSNIGHGTIIHNYSNAIDFDRIRMGLESELNLKIVGGEFITSQVFEKPILGFRPYGRPLKIFQIPIISGIEIGATYVVDSKAPLHILDSNGNPITDDEGDQFGSSTPGFTENNNLSTTTDELHIYGGDISLPLFDNEFLNVTPYTDFNKINNFGNGLHFGLMTTLNIPAIVKQRIFFRWEGRSFTRDYIPFYFDTFYEVQKYDLFLGTRDYPIPKLLALKNNQFLDPGGRVFGWFGHIDYSFVDFITVSGSYEDYQGPDNSSILLGVYFPALKFIRIYGQYMRVDFDKLSQAFKFDDRSMLFAVAEYRIFKYLFIVGSFERRWELIDEGRYKSVNTFSAGVRLSFAL